MQTRGERKDRGGKAWGGGGEFAIISKTSIMLAINP